MRSEVLGQCQNYVLLECDDVCFGRWHQRICYLHSQGTEDGGRWPLLLRRVKDCCRPSLFNPLRTGRLNYIKDNFLSHTEHIPSSLNKQPLSVYENDRCFVMIGIRNTVTCMGNMQNFVILQLVLIR